MAKHRLPTFFVILTALSCSPAYIVPPDTIRLHLGSEPDTLNPILATDAYAGEVIGNIYDSLIEMDPDTLEYKPKIAESWEVSEDHLTYTFHMRHDVRWHDGKPVTADDVVYSFGLVKDPKVDAPHIKLYYQDLKEARKIDDYTVQCIYAVPYFKALDFCGGVAILPKHVIEKDGDFEHSSISRAPMGHGPYRFTSWETNKRIVLERNEDYWGKKPEIRVIEFKIVHDESIVMQVLKKGLMDVSQLRAIQWVRQSVTEKFGAMFHKISYPGRAYSYIGWNTKRPYFSDKRVRQAMTLLIDRERMKQALQFGLATIVSGPFFPHSAQNNNNVKPLPYDPAEARQLLDEAGWKDHDGDGWRDKDGTMFRFTFLYPSGSTASERLSTIMKEDFKKVGIDVEISRMEWAAFLDKMSKKEFDATNLMWGMPFESDPYQLWHSSQADIEGSSNYISYKNAEVDRLIEQARTEFDKDKRNALYHRFHEILHDEQPYTFMYATPKLYAVSKRFDNIIVHKAGMDLLEWKIAKP